MRKIIFNTGQRPATRFFVFYHHGVELWTESLKGIPKLFFGQVVFLLAAWGTKANKPHICKKIMVCWPQRAPNDPGRTSDNLKLQRHELQPHP